MKYVYRMLVSIVVLVIFHSLAIASDKSITSGNLPFTITVQPGTLLPDQVALGSTVHAIYQVTNNNRITATNASFVSLPPHTSIDPSGCGATSRFTLLPGQSCTLTLIISPSGLLPGQIIDGSTTPNVLMACWNDGTSCAGTTDLLRVKVIPAPSLA